MYIQAYTIIYQPQTRSLVAHMTHIQSRVHLQDCWLIICTKLYMSFAISSMSFGMSCIVNGFMFKQVKKRNRKAGEFWSTAGNLNGHTGSEVESLMKNLQKEYQAVKQRIHLSGSETFEPKLRNSTELFLLYEDWYNLYHPHGGSALPSVVMTPASCTMMMPRQVTCYVQHAALVELWRRGMKSKHWNHVTKIRN